MASHQSIKSVLHNFLGTYTSRYSDYDGYWLFGVIIHNLGKLQIDLLNPSANLNEFPSIEFAIQLATQKFQEQMSKAGFTFLIVQEAKLFVTKLPESVTGLANGFACAGNNVQFLIQIVSKQGTTYESEITVFVAPHDPSIEERSSRGI